jgi:hypothetical protein
MKVSRLFFIVRPLFVKKVAGCWSSCQAPPSPFRTPTSSPALMPFDRFKHFATTPFPRKSHRLLYQSERTPPPKPSLTAVSEPDPIYPYCTLLILSRITRATTVPLIESSASLFLRKYYARKNRASENYHGWNLAQSDDSQAGSCFSFVQSLCTSDR